MLHSQINCLIFDSCNALFTELESGLKTSEEQDQALEIVAICENESDLKIEEIKNEPFEGQFRVRLFNEFELNGIIRKHPCFTIALDYNNKRAEVLSFESNLYPPIKLDAYTVHKGTKYTNVVAKNDLKTLCENWLKQLKELNYRPQWNENSQTA